MESLLLGTTISDQKIIGCWEEVDTEGNKRYNILYKCSLCGNKYETKLKTSKHSILRCNQCNKRGYIQPIIVDGKIAGYNTYTEYKWKRLRKKVDGKWNARYGQ